jgi:hypothetical protein
MTLHGTRNNFSDWATNLANLSLASKKEESFSVSKEAVGNNREDLSLPVLQRLLHDGYEIVQWDSGSSTHSTCLELNEQQWNLQDFISGLVHAAPIFERSHPGDVSCAVLVSGENLPTIRVDSFGNLDEVL